MFKIIGADQKEYGPISAEQIRQWIIDGRLNAQTRAQSDGGEWQTLSAFPEFADVLRPATAGAPPPPLGSAPAPMAMPGDVGSREAALQAVKGPAIALIVTSSIGVALCLFAALRAFAGIHPTLPPNFPEAWRHIIETTGGFPDLIGIAINGFVLFGALKMLRGQSRSLAIAACIVAMLPCSCCCVLGLPFGIWGLVVLNKVEVKSQFS
ncbi:MAG TPA: GYF domain-containing protein [Verrucomicrobiae bacterium]|jgi:hypothetical protein|nr:GYF domain-containing protein [Verrucomicrobiae bacterium]